MVVVVESSDPLRRHNPEALVEELGHAEEHLHVRVHLDDTLCIVCDRGSRLAIRSLFYACSIQTKAILERPTLGVVKRKKASYSIYCRDTLGVLTYLFSLFRPSMVLGKTHTHVLVTP